MIIMWIIWHLMRATAARSATVLVTYNFSICRVLRRHTTTYGAVHCRTWAYGDVRGECVVVRSVNGLYGTVHCRALMHADRTSTCGMCRRTAPYARLTQATQCPKHASNLMHVISCKKFQQCHWPLLEYFAFTALHALCCVLLEIAFNAGSVVLEGAATSCRMVLYPGRTDGMLAHFMVRLYIAVVCKWQHTVLSYG